MITTNTLNILVVDDDPLIRQIAGRAFRQAGYVCEIADNGIVALRKMGESKFDVAIIDLQMPEMNGYELILQAVKQKGRPAIIVLTGYPDPRLVSDLLKRGVEEVISKPVNYGTLITKVKAIADRRHGGSDGTESDIDILVRRLLQPAPSIHEEQGSCEPTQEEQESGEKHISLEELPVQSVPASDILDRQGRLLVKTGTTITPDIKRRLEALAKSVGVREPITIFS